MDMSMSKLQEMVKDREVWRAAIHGVSKSQIVKQAECKLSNCDAGEDKSPLDCKEIKLVNPKGNQS